MQDAGGVDQTQRIWTGDFRVDRFITVVRRALYDFTCAGSALEPFDLESGGRVAPRSRPDDNDVGMVAGLRHRDRVSAHVANREETESD